MYDLSSCWCLESLCVSYWNNFDKSMETLKGQWKLPDTIIELEIMYQSVTLERTLKSVIQELMPIPSPIITLYMGRMESTSLSPEMHQHLTHMFMEILERME